jgi:hypothetical protein
VICKDFGDDISEIIQLAQQIFGNGLLQAVALDPYGVGAIVDALYKVGISGQEPSLGLTRAGNYPARSRQRSGSSPCGSGSMPPLMRRRWDGFRALGR